MKKEINFRIIELPTHQVLLSKDSDDENGDPNIIVSIFISGMKVGLKFTYKEESVRDEMFNEYSDNEAQGLIDSLLKQFA